MGCVGFQIIGGHFRSLTKTNDGSGVFCAGAASSFLCAAVDQVVDRYTLADI